MLVTVERILADVMDLRCGDSHLTAIVDNAEVIGSKNLGTGDLTGEARAVIDADVAARRVDLAADSGVVGNHCGGQIQAISREAGWRTGDIVGRFRTVDMCKANTQSTDQHSNRDQCCEYIHRFFHGLLLLFLAERQTSREKLSFQSSQVSGRILAKTELLPTGFFTLLQVRTQVAPSLIIPGLKLLGREALLSGDYSSDHADGTAHDHAWNGSPPPCGSSLMNPCHPKAMFQVIVGARQALHVIAVKEANRKVVGDVAKMLNGLAQRFQRSFLLLHLTNVCQVALTNLRPGVLLRIG